MLGQICHPEFFSNPYSEYQEVYSQYTFVVLTKAFVIQASRGRPRLFYARFPNSYLKEIYKHGAKYLQVDVSIQQIQLCQSRAYDLRYPKHQAAFWTLISWVYAYLESGRSHVGDSCNNRENEFSEMVVYPKLTGVDGRTKRFLIV